MTKKAGKTEYPDFKWVTEGKEALAKEIHREYLPEIENELGRAADRMSQMKPVEFVVGSRDNFHFEVAVRDSTIVIHLYPVDLAVGFPRNMEELIKQVWWELLEGRTQKLEVGFTPMATPSWIDVERMTKDGKEIPAYPSWNVELYGYGDLPHTHQGLINDGLRVLNERMKR